MLVISRKPGESFFIGDDIVVTIIDTNLGRSKIGITAPKELSIRRDNCGPKQTSDILRPEGQAEASGGSQRSILEGVRRRSDGRS